VKEMPPRPPLLTDRIQRLEVSVKALNDELHELRLFCLDLHPDYSKRVIDTMLQIEQKVLFNVSTFEDRLDGINRTVKQLVTQSANDCLALVKDSITSKMSGLDSRLIGLNKRQAQIDKELSDTFRRLNEFSDAVEKSLDDANDKALRALETSLAHRVSEEVQQCLAKHSALSSSLHSSTATPSCLERGRSREGFRRKQETLMVRARSVSSEADLRIVITEARELAADAREQTCL
jgi:hypothetical protein